MGRESIKPLTKDILPLLAGKGIELPSDNAWQLPEKVLQFGTGVLLRGLPDYYINKANNEDVFGGRIVVVKSTGKGSSDAFAQQNNLYTHCIKGMDASGEIVETYIINAAVSRVLTAADEWEIIMTLAANPDLQVIVSNTTEVGIVLDETDNIHASPPKSFPGKLLAFLLARYNAFAGSEENGLVIIPTELIVDNGNTLKEIVCQLAQINQLEEPFIDWLRKANDWCSSLVDRIVPGALPEAENQEFEESFGYADALAIMSEPYGLWAIETKRERTKQLLSFAKTDNGIIITDNIEKYRELKLRLLNATHTFCCGLAFLSGFNAVNEAMKDEVFYSFVHQLMHREIVPVLISENIGEEEANAFTSAVLKRFANPYIHHQWLSISLQYTGKIKTRCLPLIIRYHQHFSSLPTCMMIGFAAYLVFMKTNAEKDGRYYGDRNGISYLVQDDKAAVLYQSWQKKDIKNVVRTTLDEESLWDDEFTALPHLAEEVVKYVKNLIHHNSARQLLNEFYLR